MAETGARLRPRALPQQARRDAGPSTARGTRRREDLLAAARRVFERRGYVETRVADIVAEAGVAHGTFYTYFETKDDAFAAVARATVATMLDDLAAVVPSGDQMARTRDAVTRFVEVYRPNATMIGLIEQVGLFSPAMRDLRLEVRAAFVERTEHGLERLVAEGRCRSDLDVTYTAEALGAMLEYCCYLWFCLGKDFDQQRLVAVVARAWQQAITPDPVPSLTEETP